MYLKYRKLVSTPNPKCQLNTELQDDLDNEHVSLASKNFYKSNSNYSSKLSNRNDFFLNDKKAKQSPLFYLSVGNVFSYLNEFKKVVIQTIFLFCALHFFLSSCADQKLNNVERRIEFLKNNLEKLTFDFNKHHNKLIKLNEELDGTIESIQILKEFQFNLSQKFKSYDKIILDSNYMQSFFEDNFLEEIKNFVDTSVQKHLPKIKNLILKDESNFDLLYINFTNWFKNTIDKKFELYDGDKTGKPDYALEANGATIIDSSETFDSKTVYKLFSLPIWNVVTSPLNTVRKYIPTAENCWKMNGQVGFLTIKLANAIYLESFTYEHIPKSNIINYEQFSCTPKVFKIYAYSNDTFDEVNFLGNYTFNIYKSPMFTVHFDNQYLDTALYSFIRINFLENYGNKNFTCVHRIRIHGKEKNFINKE